MNRELVIISEEPPPLSGLVEMQGTVHIVNKSLVMFAHQLREVGTEVDLDTHQHELLSLCPHSTNDLEQIDGFIERRVDDLANNVTHIYGRPELHVATDLVVHSALRFRANGHLRRGWLDANMTGPTRSGKSLCVKHLLEHYRVGQMVACMENVSRSGLTMGAMSTRSGSKVQPGLFPRNHKKMLVLDEFHHMAQLKQDDPIMVHLQSARDRGIVSGVKVYGGITLPAAVRLITICNWAKGSAGSFRFPCQHIAHFYGPPESLSRIDFAIAVTDTPTEEALREVASVWHDELCKVLIHRAWAMEADMIHFEDEVLELAQTLCARMAETYADEMPFFTKQEKVYSILRLAIAVANLTFSHPKESAYHCLVRTVHVRWAVRWLEQCFESIGYDKLSASLIRARELADPFEVESLVTVGLGLQHASQAAHVLNALIGFNQKGVLAAYAGMEVHEFDRWLGKMIKHGALEVSSTTFQAAYGPSRGGSQLMQNLAMLAESNPDQYEKRYQQLYSWNVGKASGPAEMPPPSSLSPLNVPPEELDVWSDDDSETNIIRHPTSS